MSGKRKPKTVKIIAPDVKQNDPAPVNTNTYDEKNQRR
jgi:hypothetical protein